MKGTITSLLVVVAAVTCIASADITLEVVPVDNSSAPELTGWVRQDLVVTTDTDWLHSDMIVTLDAPGAIYQEPEAPNRPMWEFPFPPTGSAEFDTYVSNGVPGELVSAVGATDLGGPPNVIFDMNHLSVTWFTTDMDDVGTLALARVTLADTATGTWQFIATAAPQGGPRVEVLDGIVENGHIVLPLGGDLDADGFVGQTDLDIVLGAWGTSPPSDPRADPDGSGSVGQDDLDTVLGDWGQGTPPPSVPEPGTLSLVLMGAMTMVRRRHHRAATPRRSHRQRSGVTAGELILNR